MVELLELNGFLMLREISGLRFFEDEDGVLIVLDDTGSIVYINMETKLIVPVSMATGQAK